MSYDATVTLTGNMVDRAEKIQGENKLFAVFSMATTDSYKNKDGEWQNKETQFHDIIVFSPKVIEQVLLYQKGQRIKVTGSLTYKSREVFDKTGKPFEIKQAQIVAGKITEASLEKKAT